MEAAKWDYGSPITALKGLFTMFRVRSSPLVLSAFALTLAAAASAQRPTNVPQLTSRAGGAYTLYLNFAGFDFTGSWGGNQTNPSTTSYATYRNAAGSFSAAQQDEIREIWARTAEKFAPFGINVTTVDPAGAGLTDRQRQAYYDAQPRVQQTIVSPTDSVSNSTASGVSYLGLLKNAYTTTQNGGAGRGYHTNFIATTATPTYPDAFMKKTTAEGIAHENGHALSLDHQADYNADGSLRDEYSDNYNAGGGGFTVNAPTGTFAPIMGFSDFTQRGEWRVGRSLGLNGGIQNDVGGIMGNAGIGGYYEDGIGNSFATATSLALSASGVVDSALAKGVVVPTVASNPNPIGEGSYQGGYYRFSTGGGAVSLRATNGSSLLQSGVADPGMTLRNVLRIYDSSLNLVATGTEESLTRWTEFTGTLTAGSYYAFVTSTGGFTSANDATARYFNMGSYFLSGSVTPVPEPASLAALGLGALAVLRRRRKSA